MYYLLATATIATALKAVILSFVFAIFPVKLMVIEIKDKII